MNEMFLSTAPAGPLTAALRPYVIGDHGGAVLNRWPAPGEAMPNHFEVLGLKPQICLDEAATDAKVKALIRQLHPDRYLRDGAAMVEKAQKHTALLNDAWRVLRDFEKRCHYVVELAGERPDEVYKPSAAELALSFERNETLDELAEAPQQNRRALQSLLGELEGDRVDIREILREDAELWDAAGGDPAGEATARRRLRTSLGRLTYLDKLRARCKELLEKTVPERA